MARPLYSENKKQVVLRYLRLYRWLLIVLVVVLLALAIFALRRLLWPS
jgi:ABC-type Fe3+-siderophore transport system permease subunit